LKDVAQANGTYYKAEAHTPGVEKLANIGNGSGMTQELSEIVNEASYAKILAMLESAQEGIECTNVKVGHTLFACTSVRSFTRRLFTLTCLIGGNERKRRWQQCQCHAEQLPH
jgi:hypothetical protein